MNDLTTFRDHARVMAGAAHKPECCRCGMSYCCACNGHPNMNPDWETHGLPTGWPEHAETCPGNPSAPPCPGCVTDADRELWTRLADEADAWLARDDEEGLFD